MPNYTTSYGYVILQKDSEVRLKIIGTRVDVIECVCPKLDGVTIHTDNFGQPKGFALFKRPSLLMNLNYMADNLRGLYARKMVIATDLKELQFGVLIEGDIYLGVLVLDEEKTDCERVMLIYDGLHYDALVSSHL